MEKVRLRENYNKWHRDPAKSGGVEKVDPRTIQCINLMLDYLDKSNGIQSGKKILDIACGDGTFLDVARKKGLEIYGLDISDVAIEKARRKAGGGNFIVGDAEHLPYQDEQFDYVTCLGSLEHFPHPEKGVQEMSRVLNRDGTAIVLVPNLMFVGHIFMAYKYGVMPSEGGQSFSEVFYTYQGWKEMLEDHGLQVIACKPYNRVFATKKVSKLMIFFWENVVRFITPFNLSYLFTFICKKR